MRITLKKHADNKLKLNTLKLWIPEHNSERQKNVSIKKLISAIMQLSLLLWYGVQNTRSKPPFIDFYGEALTSLDCETLGLFVLKITKLKDTS